MADDARWLHPDNPVFGRECWVCRYPPEGGFEWVRGYVVGWMVGQAILEDPETHRVRMVDLDDISFAESKPDA